MSKEPKREGGSSGGEDPKAGMPKWLKWVGAVSAVLSLVFGIQQLTSRITAARERRHQVNESLNVAAMQQKLGKYDAAWASVEQASQLDRESAAVRSAEESVAMEWLENIYGIEGKQSGAEIVNKLAAVLDRGAVSASGVRKADILAHLGWAEMLRTGGGADGREPEKYYKPAVELDAKNVYAHAMWGLLLIRYGAHVREAQEHFSAALSSGREREFVRRYQLGALRGLQSDECEMELLRTVNEMRKSGETIDPATKSSVAFLYYATFNRRTGKFSDEILASVGPVEHLAIVRWLFPDATTDEEKKLTRDDYLAALQEAAGQRAEALATYLSMRPRVPKYLSEMRDRVEAGIKRLGGNGANPGTK